MNKFVRLISFQCLMLQCIAAPSHESGGSGGSHYGSEHHGPLVAIPDFESFGKIQYAKSKLIDLGEYTKGDIPVKVVKISKTYAVKVPHPYPVKIKHNVPVPYPVAHPYPVAVPKIVKIPHPVPVEVIKKVEVPVHTHHEHSGHHSGPGADYSQGQDYGQVQLQQQQQQHGVQQEEGQHQQDTSGGYSESAGDHAISGAPVPQLVHYRYSQSFGPAAPSAHQQVPEGAGSEPIYQHQFAAFPSEDVQQHLNYGPAVQVSHHGIQDGVDGYSIHTVSMDIPKEPEQPQAQHQEAGEAGESAAAHQLAQEQKQ